MVWLGLGLALAAEPVTEESTYNRLFREDTTQTTEASPMEEPGPSAGSWVIPLLLLVVAGGALGWQRYKAGAPSLGTLLVLQRQPIGDRTSIVLIEVTDRDGDARRLLIGTGPGAPVLLADLGFSETPRTEARTEPRTDKRTEVPPVETPRPERTAEIRPPVRPAEPIISRQPRPSASANIAQEILAERTKVRPQDSFREEGDYDEPDAPPDDSDDPEPPPPPNRGFSRLLARIGD